VILCISATDSADSSRAVGLTAVEVEHDEPGGLVDAPDQPAVGRSFDVEGLEGDVPPAPGTHYAPRQRRPKQRSERFWQGLVAGGGTFPGGLRVGEAGALHPEGKQDLVAHVRLVIRTRDLGDHLPQDQVAEV
jgi:hypothetical protein